MIFVGQSLQSFLFFRVLEHLRDITQSSGQLSAITGVCEQGLLHNLGGALPGAMSVFGINCCHLCAHHQLLSSLCSSSTAVISVLIINCCHLCAHHQLLSSLCSSSTVVISVLIIDCCHLCAHHQLLSSLCSLSTVVISVLIINCCHLCAHHRLLPLAPFQSAQRTSSSSEGLGADLRPQH